MRSPRFMLACLICLGVSLQGFATVTAATSCPMMQATDQSTMGSAMHAETSHDCCGAGNFAKYGKLCKMSLSCQSVTLVPQTVVSLVLFAATTEIPTPSPDRALVAPDPSRVWRPPATF
jgi:hypothetical protein